MQRQRLALLLAACSIAVAAPALAAQGGNGNGNGGGNGNGNGNGGGQQKQETTTTTGPSVATQGGGGTRAAGKPTPASSTIRIASVNGAPMGAAATATPKYGDSLTFATTVEKLAGWEYPMISVTCYQDVNGDGTVDTDLFGPDIVFGILDRPSATFALAGSSLWSQRGGAASCRADLHAYGWKAGIESIRLLATTNQWPVAWS